jgi:hypothetical protein
MKQRSGVFCAVRAEMLYELVSESSLIVIVVTASVKENKTGGQGHTSTSLLHQSATWHHTVNTHCFYMSAFFNFLFRFAWDGWQNRAGQQFLNGIHISRPVKSVEDDEHSGRPSTNKSTEFIKEDCRRTIHELADTAGISYGVCQEILTENLNIYHTAPSWQRTRPHVHENHRICD